MNVLLSHAPALYEAIFRVSVALLATLVALSAILLSLLGPAIAVARASAVRSRERFLEQRRLVAERTEVLRARLGLASESQGERLQIDQALAGLMRDAKECRAALARLNRSSRSMSVRSAVLYPGLLFLCATFFAKIQENASLPPAKPSAAGLLVFLPFIAGLVLLVRTIVTLRSISQFSLPDLDLSVDLGAAPWKVGECNHIRIRARLHRGTLLATAQVVLLIPPTCDLLTTVPIWTMPDDHPLAPGYRVISSRVRDIRTWAPLDWVVEDVKPRQAGLVDIYYAVDGHGYSTGPQPLPVRVQQAG
ncbi:MAG: hypothetical protein L6R30_26220 [Thermoanaerobaculia bacterium]|nr:hypothetical protein [Thermoanaerobaculia bacterium]